MSSLSWERLSAEERLLAEQAVLQYRALRTACAKAPHGKVLGVAEDRKSTRLNSSHLKLSRMPSSA